MPEPLRKQQRPRPYNNVERSDKIRSWTQDMRAYLVEQGYDWTLPAHNDACRAVLLTNCVGDAQHYVRRLDTEAANTPLHSFRLCQGVLDALYACFTRPEEDGEARKRLYGFVMRPGMSARDYCQESDRIVDDISSTDPRDLMVHFIKSLPPSMQREVNLFHPHDIHAAMDLVVRLGNPTSIYTAPLAPASSAMEVGAIGRGNWMAGSRSGGGGGGPRGRTPPDPRSSPDWHKWASRFTDERLNRLPEQGKCFLCESSQHRWQECHNIRRDSRPTPPSRSPSPVWRARASRGAKQSEPPPWLSQRGSPTDATVASLSRVAQAQPLDGHKAAHLSAAGSIRAWPLEFAAPRIADVGSEAVEGKAVEDVLHAPARC